MYIRYSRDSETSYFLCIFILCFSLAKIFNLYTFFDPAMLRAKCWQLPFGFPKSRYKFKFVVSPCPQIQTGFLPLLTNHLPKIIFSAIRNTQKTSHKMKESMVEISGPYKPNCKPVFRKCETKETLFCVLLVPGAFLRTHRHYQFI